MERYYNHLPNCKISSPQIFCYVPVRSVYSTPQKRILAGVCAVLLPTEFIISLGCIGAGKDVERQSSENMKILLRSEGQCLSQSVFYFETGLELL